MEHARLGTTGCIYSRKLCAVTGRLSLGRVAGADPSPAIAPGAPCADYGEQDQLARTRPDDRQTQARPRGRMNA